MSDFTEELRRNIEIGPDITWEEAKNYERKRQYAERVASDLGKLRCAMFQHDERLDFEILDEDGSVHLKLDTYAIMQTPTGWVSANENGVRLFTAPSVGALTRHPLFRPWLNRVATKRSPRKELSWIQERFSEDKYYYVDATLNRLIAANKSTEITLTSYGLCVRDHEGKILYNDMNQGGGVGDLVNRFLSHWRTS